MKRPIRRRLVGAGLPAFGGLMLSLGFPLMTQAESARPVPVSVAAASAVRLITRGVEAMGGEAAIRKQTTRLTSGWFESSALGFSGEIEILQAAPKRTCQKLVVAKALVITMGTDGKEAWIKLPGWGVQDFAGRQRDQFIDDGELFKVLSFSTRYTNLVVAKPVRVGGVDCDVVAGLNRLGQKESIYFGRKDGFLRRWDRPSVDPAGGWAPTETYFDDYREVDGLKLPFKIYQPVPAGQAFTLTVSEVKHGVDAPPSKFQRPNP